MKNTIVAGESANSNTGLFPTQNQLRAPYLERFVVLKTIYGKEDASHLLGLLEKQGRNSFNNVYDRIKRLNTLSTEETLYYKALRDSFDIGKPCMVEDLMETVFSLRLAHGLEMFTSSPLVQCLDDVSMCFLWKKDKHTNSDTGEIEEVYTPEFMLYA